LTSEYPKMSKQGTVDKKKKKKHRTLLISQKLKIVRGLENWHMQQHTTLQQ
jgi:hypothetical protein